MQTRSEIHYFGYGTWGERLKGHEKKVEPEVLTGRFKGSAGKFSLVTTLTSTGKNYSK